MNWASLGLPSPRAIKLDGAARARLAHLAEFRDISSPGGAARASAEFASEPHFAGDLRRVRSWLDPQTPRREVLPRVLDAEWTGFLALIGEYGPWVYAGTVRDVQDLSARYAALVVAAAQADEQSVWTAAQLRPDSLLTRLEATTYRQPARGAATDLAPLETAFWAEAERQATARRR